jgi:hypothetical protein
MNLWEGLGKGLGRLHPGLGMALGWFGKGLETTREVD